MPAVEALIVNTAQRGPGQLSGIGDAGAASVLDNITGGEYSRVGARLDSLELWLKVSIIASVVAGAAGLLVLFRRKR